MNTHNQNISGSRSIGGARSIFTDVGLVLLTGGFEIAKANVPDLIDGYIPAGTPLQVDEVNRTAVPFKVAKVATATTPVTGDTTIDVVKQPADDFGKNPLKVGDTIMVLGSDLTTAGLGVTISAIDTTTSTTVDTITVSDAVVVVEGDYLILSDKASASAAVPAVIPNCITPYDIIKDPDASQVYCEACVSLLNGQIYERRIPILPPLIKKVLYDNGCNFQFTQSK